uniref:Chromo domain-containing protein n=1 Tax=Nelumbo nucifera TaxID=4432 RepID=A0A822YTZ8_NELNU|nr:TPA_asm: hypothetical protein HUJ06_006647 [Nelumbo nucifera]
MKRWADQKEAAHIGDLVLVKLLPQQFKSLRKVECILTNRTVRRHGVPPYKEYFIKWKNFPNSEASWERAEDLWQFKHLI